MSANDQTKQLLEKLLSDLYAKQASTTAPRGESYLLAQDNQFLGNITDNQYDSNSILNVYGPYGSPYSTTSIFNEYSPYGSPYGAHSLNNPFCTTPPKLFLRGSFAGFVTKNQFVTNAIPTEGFLYSLKNNIQSLLAGQIIQSEVEARRIAGDSFIQAADGAFLGSIRPDPYNPDSIFNQYGAYGSQYAQFSIFNPYGTYGGGYSNLSPFNPYATQPPHVIHKGAFVAYLTVNANLAPRIAPDAIMNWAQQNVSMYGLQ